MKPMTIGGLSKAAGVKVTTIRYYESVGLMGEPERSASGQRHYDNEAVQRLSFIRHARDLGQKLSQLEALEAELKRMISACEGGKISSCKVLESLSDHSQCLDTHDGKKLTAQIGGRI